MKILLIRPHPYLKTAKRFQSFLRLEPLDLELIAAGIDPQHEIRILDLEVVRSPLRAFKRMLREYAPEMVAFGGYSSQARHVRELARLVKERLPASKVVAGGVHATIAAEDFNLPGIIDIVVRGDGCSVLGEIVNAIGTGGDYPEDSRILNVGSDEFDTLAASPLPPLNECCITTLPRRDLIDPSKYFCVVGGSEGERLPTLFPQVASMRTSVGCPHRCRFCVVHFLASGKYLQRTPEAVVDEIESLPQEYIYFVDDEMFINPRRAHAIALLLKERGIRKRYISWARADTICENRDLFELWKSIGLETLYVGLESLDEHYLEDYNKGASVAQNRQAVAMLRELGIGLHAALIVNPDFEEEHFLTLRRAIDFISPAEISFTVFSPSPGTELFQEHIGGFVCEDPYLFYDCMHTIVPTVLPLDRFYRYFSLLYLFAFRRNPWREKKIKVPVGDLLRLLWNGLRCGFTLRNIYRDYDRKLW